MPAPTLNGIVSSLRFFFTHTLDRPDLARRLVLPAYPRTLPVVLSREEVGRMLVATICLKHLAALSWPTAAACAWPKSRRKRSRTLTFGRSCRPRRLLYAHYLIHTI